MAMAVTCSNCGEELLGAVNRCWKCGSAFAAPPKTADEPPVRRAPVPIEQLQAYSAMPAGAENGSVMAEVLDESGAAIPARPEHFVPQRRRGSPFADTHAPATRPAAAVLIRPARPYAPPVDHARHSAA